MLSGLLKDRVALVKADGTTQENIRALVQPKKIFIDDASVPVEEGDRLIRELPNGLRESYLVLDRGFFGSSHGIEGHYQIEVRKESRPPDPARTPTTVIYNLHGSNSRVNIQSTDASVNIVDATPEVLFEELRTAIRQAVADEKERTILLKAVAALESKRGEPGFLPAYQKFMTLAASHMAVLSPFIPALSQLLK